MANTPDLDNYRAYNKGKAKLKNAILIPKDDKIQDFMRKNVKHRFWVNDYNSFKKKMNEETGVMGLAPGEGNPVAPTPTSLGSGDKFQSDKKKPKKKEKLNESYGDKVDSFSYPLSSEDITIINTPDEFGDLRVKTATIHYDAELETNNFGIENIIFAVKNIVLEFEFDIFAPDDVNGDRPMTEEKNFNVEKPHVEIEINQMPFYPSDMTIDMKKNSTNPIHWTFDIQMGRDHYRS